MASRTSTRQRKPSSKIMLTKMLEDDAALYSAMRKNLQQRANKQSIPECPVFRPTAAEWQADPLAYIHTLADAGEEAGIVKIILPPECRPSMEVCLPDDVVIETKRQHVHRLQDGQAFDDGVGYTHKAYIEYATRVRAEWEQQYPHHAARLAQALQDGGDAAVTSVMEEVYWNMVERVCEEDVFSVEYASDIDTGRLYDHIPPIIRNLSLGKGSLLTKLGRPVGGLTVPWLYFGALFSTFCWHTEDHFLFSCNYHHHGAAKTWYGIPMDGARKCEEVLRLHMPHLFRKDRDVLHQLTLVLSPYILTHAGVPVYHAIQQPGEIIVTYPRAYHCGFNHGYNCAEAANVAMWNWLPVGQLAVDSYSSGPNMRPAVFSHERVLWAWVLETMQPMHVVLKTGGLPMCPRGREASRAARGAPLGPPPALAALLQRVVSRAGLSGDVLRLLKEAAADEVSEGCAGWCAHHCPGVGDVHIEQVPLDSNTADLQLITTPPPHWFTEWMMHVVMHDTTKLDTDFVSHLRTLATTTTVHPHHDRIDLQAHLEAHGLHVGDNVTTLHDAVLSLGVRELHARWMLRKEGCEEDYAPTQALAAEDVTCDLCSALPFFSYIKCRCGKGGEGRVACSHTDRCWAYCGCELSSRVVMINIPDHEILQAMAALWLAIPAAQRTKIVQEYVCDEELQPRAEDKPMVGAKRKQGPMVDPSSSTRDSDWGEMQHDGVVSEEETSSWGKGREWGSI